MVHKICWLINESPDKPGVRPSHASPVPFQSRIQTPSFIGQVSFHLKNNHILQTETKKVSQLITYTERKKYLKPQLINPIYFEKREKASMASKFGLAGGIPERRVRPIWDAIDSRQFKNALKHSTSLLAKCPNSPYALVRLQIFLRLTQLLIANYCKVK